VEIEDMPVVKVPFGDAVPDDLGDLSGRAVIAELPAAPKDADPNALFNARRAFITRIEALRPAAFVQVRREVAAGSYFALRSLGNEATKRLAAGPPVVSLSGSAAWDVYQAMPTGRTNATLTVHLAAPAETRVLQRNVVGLLPGSDPRLADGAIILSAHYDGQGRLGVDGFNSANDNGSGTVSVVEIASALASLERRPRRSIIFIAYHGEESGLVGSRYYAEHPLWPIEKTLAEINVEMVGRTDDVEGDQHRRASVTGFDYSDVGEVLRLAGADAGVTVFKHPKNSDPYFNASDNVALANLGVPAHTICVTYQYPDYHRPADTWDKIDYDNMALTVRVIASGLLALAQSPNEPRWNAAAPRAARFLEAWKKRRGGS
jgi:hypothetical protein